MLYGALFSEPNWLDSSTEYSGCDDIETDHLVIVNIPNANDSDYRKFILLQQLWFNNESD